MEVKFGKRVALRELGDIAPHTLKIMRLIVFFLLLLLFVAVVIGATVFLR